MTDEIRMGIYRHWKGPLYQVLGLASDANTDGRVVVLYIGLQLDDAKPGPRIHARTLDDFTAVIHTDDGGVCAQAVCSRIVGSRFADRFTYLGPELTDAMLAGDGR